MIIQVSQAKEVSLVQIETRLEADSAQDFRDVMSDLTAESRYKVVIDLAKVSFIDSSGLGCLVSAVRQFRQEKGDIKLACITDNVRPLIEIVRLHRVFDIYDSVEEAMKSFG